VAAVTVTAAIAHSGQSPTCGQGEAVPSSRNPTRETAIPNTATGVDALALRYEPTVKMSRLDGYWPVSVQSVLQEQGPDGQGVQLMNKSGDPLADPATLADLKASGKTTDYLEYPAVLADKTGQRDAFLRGIGVPEATINAWPNADLSAYVRNTGQIYFYDGGTDCSYPGGKTVGDRALQYWFFYGLNYYPMTVNTATMLSNPLQADNADIDFHEGDWEHITVLLSRDNTPELVWMARHSSEGTLISWNDVQHDGTHPVIYPAFGGHPSYPDCGAHARTLLAAAVYDYVPCSPGEYTLPGGTTRLVDLAKVSWSCWPGHFGTAAGTTATSNADDPSGAILVAGPNSPLRQAENKTACRSPTANKKAG
jgi:Vacuolar protein sorting-associated protein 62